MLNIAKKYRTVEESNTNQDKTKLVKKPTFEPKTNQEEARTHNMDQSRPKAPSLNQIER